MTTSERISSLCLVLLLVLALLPRQACSLITITSSRHPPYKRLTSVPLLFAKSTSKVDPSTEKTGFFWEYQGFPCYAEVAMSASSLTKNSWKSVLPTTLSLASGITKKPSVILVHGFGCSTVYWRETRRYLTRAGYTVHALDLLGQGRSAKPGRSSSPPIEYSISLWAQMVDDYARRYISRESNVVLVGNSLGSLVALSSATGDWYNDRVRNMNGVSIPCEEPFLPTKIKGLCFYNCGVGMNTRNVLKTIPQEWLRAILSIVYGVFDLLIFENKPLLTFLADNQVNKGTLRKALLSLYAYADDPPSRVDDELVDSFVDPVVNDDTTNVVEVISQIYLNDAGKTPMELHEAYLSNTAKTGSSRTKDPQSSFPFSALTKNFSIKEQSTTEQRQLPIHVIWGDKDAVTPLNGAVGRFYTRLAMTDTSKSLADVSMQVIRAGHIPFDERPECNEGLVAWLDQLGQSKMNKYQVQSSTSTFPNWQF
jgi:pimeloyl-ACP methyl ester carboxylesterase